MVLNIKPTKNYSNQNDIFIDTKADADCGTDR